MAVIIPMTINVVVFTSTNTHTLTGIDEKSFEEMSIESGDKLCSDVRGSLALWNRAGKFRVNVKGVVIPLPTLKQKDRVLIARLTLTI